ncbi:MAG: SDR family oxidoreductase [Paludibacteraceae bacterium]|nr:SDR family oxidoreductase [Paludibacteraceae bacterium]
MLSNPFSLESKTVLITGASSGIGRATAIECAKIGAHCVITGRNQERLQQTFEQLEGQGHVQIIADLASQEGIQTLAEQVPQLDGLVNNAGINLMKPIGFIKGDDLEKIYTTNTFAPILLTKFLLKKKKLNAGASIVFISSSAAMGSGIGNAVYGTSKAAIMSFSKYCARELAPKIRSNSIHPGMVETELIQGREFSDADMEADRQKYLLKRYGKPEEIAYSVIFLLSDASAWITGHALVIDGGRRV